MSTDATDLAGRYERDGFLIVDPLLSSETIGQLKERTGEITDGQSGFPVESIELEPGATSVSLATVRKLNDCAIHDPVFRAHADHPDILDIVESLIGPDIKLFDAQLFMKPPGGIEKTYHQDSAYFPLDPQVVVTCWTAIDDVTTENGCMFVIPGSHQTGILDHDQPWMVGDRQDMQVSDSLISWDQEVPLTLSAGGCSFHHGILLHRSGANTTATSRRGLAVHYIPGNVRWTDTENPAPELPVLRGRDTTSTAS